jgi:hypothetical protein
MVALVANSEFQAQLIDACEFSEVRDGTGRLLGFFMPAPTADDEFYRRAMAQADPAETERRLASNERRLTTAEVMARLDASEQGQCHTP